VHWLSWYALNFQVSKFIEKMSEETKSTAKRFFKQISKVNPCEFEFAIPWKEHSGFAGGKSQRGQIIHVRTLSLGFSPSKSADDFFVAIVQANGRAMTIDSYVRTKLGEIMNSIEDIREKEKFFSRVDPCFNGADFYTATLDYITLIHKEKNIPQKARDLYDMFHGQ
jgi:hypothetical protein